MISDGRVSFHMKTLSFVRDEKKGRVTVACAEGPVSVSTKCAYCRHCKGSDENLMNAAMMFNTLVRDGNAISCDDDADAGYLALY